MIVLWLGNGFITSIAEKFGKENGIGWIDGALFGMNGYKDIEIVYCFPYGNEQKLKFGSVGNTRYFVMPSSPYAPEKYWKPYEAYCQEVLDIVKPDIVHIWGTEYCHSLAMARVVQNKARILVSIQGLCSIYEKHWYAHLPYSVVRTKTFRDLVRHDSIIDQKKKTQKRGLNEVQTLNLANAVIGRTDWDKACSFMINPKAHYYHCNETLREVFYNTAWNYEDCRKHSIFISQVYSSIKGFHILLEAMAEVIKYYPDAMIYTTGDSLLNKPFYRRDSYGRYLDQLIKKHGLMDHVHFLGKLTAKQMLEQYLSANVFVLPSSIENSPNSLGEAMLVGTPIVAADVGGVNCFVTHKESGYLYQSDAPYMLAYYIMKTFSLESNASEMGEKAQLKAQSVFDREENAATLARIYYDVKKEIS